MPRATQRRLTAGQQAEARAPRCSAAGWRASCLPGPDGAAQGGHRRREREKAGRWRARRWSRGANEMLGAHLGPACRSLLIVALDGLLHLARVLHQRLLRLLPDACSRSARCAARRAGIVTRCGARHRRLESRTRRRSAACACCTSQGLRRLRDHVRPIRKLRRRLLVCLVACGGRSYRSASARDGAGRRRLAARGWWPELVRNSLRRQGVALGRMRVRHGRRLTMRCTNDDSRHTYQSIIEARLIGITCNRVADGGSGFFREFHGAMSIDAGATNEERGLAETGRNRHHKRVI